MWRYCANEDHDYNKGNHDDSDHHYSRRTVPLNPIQKSPCIPEHREPDLACTWKVSPARAELGALVMGALHHPVATLFGNTGHSGIFLSKVFCHVILAKRWDEAQFIRGLIEVPASFKICASLEAIRPDA